MKKPVHIRAVNGVELPQLLKLCALHAAYEQLPFQLNGQVNRLAEDLFSQTPKLYCFVAIHDQELVAYATYMKQYATWEAKEYLYLDCLFVKEEVRSEGIGELLMERVKQESEKLACYLIQWQTPEFNKRAMKFYYRMGAESKTKERFFLNL